MHTVESLFEHFNGISFFSLRFLILAIADYLGCSFHCAHSWIVLLRINNLLHVRSGRMIFTKF